MRPAILALAGLLLAGCADVPVIWTKAGADAAALERQKATCRMAARMVPPGSGQSTAAGDALVDAAVQLGQYRDCMVAAGWEAR